jgi:hypothetical protein
MLANIQYRTVALDLTYTVADDSTMTAHIVSRPPLPCHVTTVDDMALFNAPADAPMSFPVRNGERYAVMLGTPS